MAFSQATITEVFPPVFRDGQLFVHWTSTSPAGTWFQIYVNRRLAWWGQGTNASFPYPTGTRVRVDLGAVAATEVQTDFSGSLPASSSIRARLAWQGGTFEDPLIQGYRVYGESTPGGGINYNSVMATIPAYDVQPPADGFGLGGFGDGGFGYAASYYAWTSHDLTTGSWTFAVVPYDQAGNEGPGSTVAVAIVAPPAPPARNAQGKRLTYSYNAALDRVTLNWLASPG